MNKSNDQKNVYRTGGVGSPSAGTVGGGRAGPTGSISCNRGVRKVDPRASPLVTVTGDEVRVASRSMSSRGFWTGYDEKKFSMVDFIETYRSFQAKSGKEARAILKKIKRKFEVLGLEFSDYERIRKDMERIVEEEEKEKRVLSEEEEEEKEKRVLSEEEEKEEIDEDEEETIENEEDKKVRSEEEEEEEIVEDKEDMDVEEEKTSGDGEEIDEKEVEKATGMETETSGEMEMEIAARMEEGRIEDQEEENLTEEGRMKSLGHLGKMLASALQSVTDLESDFNGIDPDQFEYTCLKLRLDFEEMLSIQDAVRRFHQSGLKKQEDQCSVETQTEDVQSMCAIGIQTVDEKIMCSVSVQTEDLHKKMEKKSAFLGFDTGSSMMTPVSYAGKVKGKFNKKVNGNLPVFGSPRTPEMWSALLRSEESVAGPSAGGPGALGPGVPGPSVLGPGAFGPGVLGPGVLGPGAFGPAVIGPGLPAKRKRTLVQEEWKEVQSKSKKSVRNVEVKMTPVVAVDPPKITSRPRWSVPRSDAILVKSGSVEEARLVRSLIDSDNARKIKKIKLNKSFQIIIELDENNSVNDFKMFLKSVLPSNIEVQVLTKSFDLEIRDLDPLVDGPTILDELAKQLEIPGDELDLKVLRTTSIGTQIAVVNTPTKWMQKILVKEKVRIGFCYVRLSPSPRLLRCYRCQELGHTSQRCTVKLAGDTRCRRCGVEGHVQASCTDGLACLDCVRLKLSSVHLMGSMACPVFRRRVLDSKAHLVEFLKETEKKDKSSTEVRNYYLRPGKHKKFNINGSDTTEMST